VVAMRGGKLSEDFVVPFERLGDALATIDEIGAAHGVEVTSWGHAGDGNVHATVLVDRSDPEQLARAEAAAHAFFNIPTRLQGALSGEHGIGLVKLQAAARLPEPLLRAQADVARALDPHNLANPGRKIPRKARDDDQ
jgi:FAD/FMN-containing dehydrogenase